MRYKVPTHSKRIFLASFLLALVGLVYYLNIRGGGIDLLVNQDWSHFAGAETTPTGIKMKPLGLVIGHKDTSVGQQNPPVNVRGPHLLVPNNFQIEAKMSGIENGATLQFYGQVPVIYDEWRQERQSIRVDVSGQTLKVRIWDGSSSTSVDERSFKIEPKENATLTIRHRNEQIIVFLNKKRLGSMPGHNIFTHGTVWFGADATIGSQGWTLNSLLAKSLEKKKVEIVPPPTLPASQNGPDTLRGLARQHPRNLPIGVAISLYPLMTDKEYRDITLSQFSMLTPENSMKPHSIHPLKDVYTYTDSDSLVEIAEKNNMLVHGHALVLPKANPQWMEQTPKEKRKQVMIDHINNVVGHFKGKVASWDVVNEPMSEEVVDYTNQNLGLRKQMWFEAMGEEYIEVAFRTARAADPTAKLYLNDFGLAEDNMRWNGLVALIKRLQAKGVPIDGVGFESHVYFARESINSEILKKHIQELATLGIIMRISEIDITGGNTELQASQYAGVLKVCLSEPTCTSYGTWGITDLYGSTTLSDRYPLVLGDSLLWDTKFMPKPAYSAMRDVLKGALH